MPNAQSKKMTDKEIKKYTVIDWTRMVPGAIIGGIMITPQGVGLGSAWGPETEEFSPWKRFCLSEHIVNLKDKLPVTIISRTGVSVYCTNNRNLNEIVVDAAGEHSRNANVPVKLIYGEPVGIFVGNVLRVEGETHINLITLDGKDVWLPVICDFTSSQQA